MKIELGKVLSSVEGLRKLVNENLPVKTAYRLKRIMDAVTSSGTGINKIRIELINKYADPQTDEQKANKEPPKITTRMPEFQNEFLLLLQDEIELNCVQIPFKDIEHIKLSVNDLTALEPWFEGIPVEFTSEVTANKTTPEIEPER